MSTAQPVTLPAMPVPLNWHGIPVAWSFDNQVLSITAGQHTDWFVDPAGQVNVLNAPALLGVVQSPCILSAYVQAANRAIFDAGVLVAYQSDDYWAKLCLELSPQKQTTIVSVVTKGTSDDCNSVTVNGDSVHMRLSVLEKAIAFHYSTDGRLWNLVRYFGLRSGAPIQIGFLSQSPTGEGCTATFSNITFVPEKLADIRSGL